MPLSVTRKWRWVVVVEGVWRRSRVRVALLLLLPAEPPTLMVPEDIVGLQPPLGDPPLLSALDKVKAIGEVIAPRSPHDTSTVTLPSCVNLTAFPHRLTCGSGVCAHVCE